MNHIRKPYGNFPMSKNVEFGRRVRRAREDLGLKRKALAEFLNITLRRLEMIEVGQLDDSDLSQEELQRLASSLQRPVSWLRGGFEPSAPSGSFAVIAQRSSGRPAQQPLGIGTDWCPQCHHNISGLPRCSNCGFGID